MTKIHILRTGSVWIKAAQVRAKGAGIKRIYNGLFDSAWSQELPIYAYLIEHDEGLILVDTGETAAAMRPGYYQRWHPYYWVGMKLAVKPEHEIGPQLCAAGFDPAAVGTVALTHLHTDHAGGLGYFPKARILVTDIEWKVASGFAGRAGGYPNHRWPQWLKPELLSLPKPADDLMAASVPITRDGTVRAVAAPGHTLGHMAVSVESYGVLFLLAGDVSYLVQTLLDASPDGLGADPEAETATHRRILACAASRPLVYLNAHDASSPDRLARREALRVA
jgi:N-acyl homoserine lactone hydrolase